MSFMARHGLMLLAVFILFTGCAMLAAFPPLGIIMIIAAFAISAGVQRRRKREDDERRHKELVQAMKEANDQ